MTGEFQELLAAATHYSEEESPDVQEPSFRALAAYAREHDLVDELERLVLADLHTAHQRNVGVGSDLAEYLIHIFRWPHVRDAASVIMSKPWEPMRDIEQRVASGYLKAFELDWWARDYYPHADEDRRA